MDAELKARWVEALRSGKYKQGRGVLRLASPHQVDLSNRNDKGASFADIADYIEANL